MNRGGGLLFVLPRQKAEAASCRSSTGESLRAARTLSQLSFEFHDKLLHRFCVKTCLGRKLTPCLAQQISPVAERVRVNRMAAQASGTANRRN